MSQKCLVIGDSHLKISRIEDCRKYIDTLISLIEVKAYDYVILLGDQTDTFSVIRSEVLSLWTTFFLSAAKHSKVIALVGNHDYAGHEGGSHSMEPFFWYDNVTVVDTVKEVMPGVWAIPFMRDKQMFETACRTLPPNSALLCHQTFDTAKYENGFYDPDGVTLDAVAHLRWVISGHVHLQQKINNIWYPGIPYQMSFADAGEKKEIFELIVDSTGPYQVAHAFTLDMPSYVVLSADTVPELLSKLPKPDPNTSYKLVANGTPQEIANFWSDNAVQSFKKSAKRVVDAFVPKRESLAIRELEAVPQQERLYAFISHRKWRSPEGRVIESARKILTD